MKIKLIAVLVVVAAIFIGAVLWRTDSFVYGDRMSWVEAQARTQIGAINRSLGTELKSLQRVIATFNTDNFQKGRLNWNSLTPYYAAASFTVRGNNLEPQTLLVKENSKAAGWTTEFIKSVISPLDKPTPDLRFYVKPFQDSQRGRYVALVFLDGAKAYALFGSGETFQSLIDSQRGALSSFSIVTSMGLTVGHSIPEYLGTMMRDDPVFKEALAGGSSHGSNIFNLKSGKTYGMYELVPQSNMLVISSAPLAETMKGRVGLWWQFLLMGCGLVTVGVAVILWVIVPVEKQIEELETQVRTPASKAVAAAIAIPVMKTKAADPEVSQKDKMEASMRVASALAHEMRGPLASILGYSQAILAKQADENIMQSANSIVRETRSARGVLDKLLGFAGENAQEKNSLKIEGPLVKVLKEMDSVLSLKGVKVIKDIKDTAVLNLHVDAIVRALKNILQNSVEAMERMPKKEIKISLFDDTAGTHLMIEDSGEGIEPADVGKIFDPFFTTRSFQNHMGLGLSVAFGILKEHRAEFNVESQRGRGTTVRILFRKDASESLLRAPPAKRDEVMIAPELPQLKVESEHRQEAENAFAQIKAAQIPGSPLDINIEKLLELPEVSIADSAVPKVTPEAALDLESTVIQAGDAVADFKPDHIPPPAVPAPVKASKVESFKVEIRKPGKRI